MTDSFFTGDITDEPGSNGDSGGSGSSGYDAKGNVQNNLNTAIQGFGYQNGGTSAFSFNFNGGAGGGVTVGFNIAWDSQGNFAVQEVTGVGLDSLGASLTLNVEQTNARDVFQLEGRGGQGGVDGGEILVGEGGLIQGVGYEGYYVGTGLGVGSPVGASIYTTNTKNILEFNVFDEWNNVKEVFGFGNN